MKLECHYETLRSGVTDRGLCEFVKDKLKNHDPAQTRGFRTGK